MAWRRAHALTINVQRASRRFPRVGYGSTRSQMIRAVESIGANIVEGCGAATQKEFARFLDIAIKSTSELENHLLVARDYGIMSHLDFHALASETIEIRKMVCGLRRRVLGQ
jgi:four helix bundle protein